MRSSVSLHYTGSHTSSIIPPPSLHFPNAAMSKPKSKSNKKRSRSSPKPGQLDKRAKRQARHDEDVMFRAALLQWLPTSRIRESLTMVLPTEVMEEITQLTLPVSRWLLFNPSIILNHLWEFLNGDCLPAVKRLNRHWSTATKACPAHNDQRLYLDTVIRDWKAWNSVNAGKRQQRESFFAHHKTAFVNSRHWVLRSSDIKGWADFASSSMDSRLNPVRASLISFEVWWFKDDRADIVTRETAQMTSLQHLQVYYPGWLGRQLSSSPLRSLVVVPIQEKHWGGLYPLSYLLADWSQLRMLAVGSIKLTGEAFNALIKEAPVLEDIRIAGDVCTFSIVQTKPRGVRLEIYNTGRDSTGRDSQRVLQVRDMSVIGRVREHRHQRYCVDRVNERLRLSEWRLRK